MDKAAEIRMIISATDKNAAETLAHINGGMKTLTGTVSALAIKYSAIGIVAQQAAQAMAAMARKVWDVAKAGMEAEKLLVTLKAATGTLYEAARADMFLRDTAQRLGLELAPLAQGFVTVAAAAKGTALEGAGARDIFAAVSTAAGALRLSTEQANGALLAIGQMISKGTVQAEELRGQLGERLPGAFQIAARAVGVTTAELGKMLEAGQVIAEEFIPKFAIALQEKYASAAEEAATTTQAAVSRMSNAWLELKRTLGEKVLPAVSAAVVAINNALQKIAPVTVDGKIAKLRKEIEGIEKMIAQPLYNRGLLDDLAEKTKELEKLERLASGINYSAGNWAQGARDLAAAETELAHAQYRSMMSGRARREMDSLPAYIPYNDLEDQKNAQLKAKAAMQQALDEQIRAQEEYKNSLAFVTDEYNRLTMSAQEYKKNQIWQEWEREAAKMSDVAQAARDLAIAAVDTEYALAKMKKQADFNILLMPSGYSSDSFIGKKKAEERAQAMIDNVKPAHDAMIALSENTAKQMEKNFSSFYFNVIKGQFDSLEDFIKGVLDSIARMTADILGQMTREMLFGVKAGETSLVSSISSAIAGMFTPNAQGNVYSGPGISAYSSSVVTSPTIFPFARGVGLMGEAGAEGILPLKRMAGGDLGVQASMDRPNVTVNVQNYGEQPVSAKQQDIYFDAQGMVLNFVIDGYNRDVNGFRQFLGGR